MADTSIEWADKVWNPTVGCSKIGQGCKNCYAERFAVRLQAMGKIEYQDTVQDGRWTGKITHLPVRLGDPYRWKKPARIFVDSMSDLFHPNVDSSFQDSVFQTMANLPRHTFLVLTKRPLQMAANTNTMSGKSVPNILLGCSASTQEDLDRSRVAMSYLSAIGWRTFLSLEPQLESVDLTGWKFLDWLISGAETGPGARYMPLDAPKRNMGWASANNIPFFFKRWGPWAPGMCQDGYILHALRRDFPAVIPYDPDTDTWELP